MARTIESTVFIGNHTPRRCGLATFTADVAAAVATCGVRADVVAMNDVAEGYDYPDPVRLTIDQNDATQYRGAAAFLNFQGYDVACLQHEYGIFGGRAGEHVLETLRNLRMPLVTTLHTILREPDVHQRRVLDEILALSERVVVMTACGRDMLREVHGVAPERIDLIPHGVPDVPMKGSDAYKARLGLEGHRVMMTFGLLSPDKGIETVIRALPSIVARHPDVVYLVVGETHPHIRRRSGESYREGLKALADELGIGENVRFHDAFVELEELTDFLQAADIYVTPYLKLQQITSGTLSYALACGKAIVSTPYWHAEELLADDRGILVPPRDDTAMAREVNGLLDDSQKLQGYRERAYAYGRTMTWGRVGERYLETFERARRESATRLRQIAAAVPASGRGPRLPDIDLRHLMAMTDDVGLLQHATYTVPNRAEGYCTDDNARALLLAAELGHAESERLGLLPLVPRYLAFLQHAFVPKSGRFRNFMGYDRQWLEDAGSEDSHGRAVWALGRLMASDLPEGLRKLASDIVSQAMPALLHFTSPRAWAFGILGLEGHLNALSGDRRARDTVTELSHRLAGLYEAVSQSDWRWFENSLSYDNARLPEAMLVAGRLLGDGRLTRIGLDSLRWLCALHTSADGSFAPIGCEGFICRGGERAWFDQQPIEACAAVAACLDAARSEPDSEWRAEADRAFAWFLGWNLLGLPIIDFESGGCRDGLHPDRVNENEGAESTLAFLMALVDMRREASHTSPQGGAQAL